MLHFLDYPSSCMLTFLEVATAFAGADAEITEEEIVFSAAGTTGATTGSSG